MKVKNIEDRVTITNLHDKLKELNVPENDYYLHANYGFADDRKGHKDIGKDIYVRGRSLPMGI